MGKKKILVVDYDQSVLVNLQQILTKEGYEVILAGDGQVAWDKYNVEDPDLVLMEAMLSKIHGFELCQRITSVHERRVPVFIMTGVYKDRVYRTEALRSYGASEYFEKPLKMAEILTSIEAVIGKSEPEQPAPEPEPDPDLAPGYAEASASAAALQKAVPAEPRKPEKPKRLDEESRWAFDLESLEKEIPKIMAVPSTRADKKKEPKPAEDDIDLVAQVLKSYPPIEPEKPKDQRNNGNEAIEIDNILKSALADLDLTADKNKVPKAKPKTRPAPEPSPQPPPPVKPREAAAPAPPPIERPRPVPPREPVAPPSPPERMRPVPPRAAPQPPPPSRPAEKPKAAAPPPPPAPAPEPKPRMEERAGRESRSPDWEKPPPAAAPTELRRSVLEDAKLRQTVPTGTFEDLYEKKGKPALPPLLAGGAVVVVLAVASFFIFRPKPSPPLPVSPVPAAAAAFETPAGEEPMPETAAVQPPAVEPETKQPAAMSKPSAPAPKKAAPIKTDPVAPAGDEEAAESLIAPISMAANPGLALQVPEAPRPDEKKPAPPPVKAEGTALPVAGGDEDAAAVPPDLVTPVEEGDLVDLLEVDRPPSVARRVEPVYPPAALRLGVEGTITVNALVNENGRVIDTGILRGIKDDRGLERAAQAAVRKWTFEPASKNGVNVKVWMPVVITFKIVDGGLEPGKG